MDSFYENIGGKLKNWAKFIFVAEAVAKALIPVPAPIAAA